MMRARLKTLCLAVVAAVTLATIWYSPVQPKAHLPALQAVTFRHEGSEHKIIVEMALTPEQQMQGLMYRKHLDKDKGMLFPLREARPMPMWMKNTRIPLDMIFIGRNQEITHIHANATPLSETVISSEGPVIGVLELAGGRAAELDLHIGDQVEYEDPYR